MPEMLEHFGKEFTVTTRVERACDTVTYAGVRRLPDTVILDDERCNGSGHAGCQAQCRLYWKEAWLEPVADGTRTRVGSSADGFDELERLVTANTTTAGSTPEDMVFMCQATELVHAGESVSWYDIGSFIRELTTGNVRPLRWVYVMVRIVLHEVGLRLGLTTRGFSPFRPRQLPARRAELPAPRGLQVGELVQIRSKEKIRETLNRDGMNRGMSFDKEMVPYCGRTARVQSKVARFVDEKTGRMVELASDAYILEGVVCRSYRSDKRWFCARAIYPWWREVWLDAEDGAPDARA